MIFDALLRDNNYYLHLFFSAKMSAARQHGRIMSSLKNKVNTEYHSPSYGEQKKIYIAKNYINHLYTFST